MKSIVQGILDYQQEDHPEHQALFDELANSQSPEVLLVTCADSRINPNLVTRTAPGDLFVCRNAGNIVPPMPGYAGGVTASIEFAVSVLGVKDIVVMGHTDCGAMKGAMNPDAVAHLPSVANWLGFAKEATAGVSEADRNCPSTLLKVTEANVLLQLEHLKTHVSVAEKLSIGQIGLHGWVYHFATGDVTAYDAEADKFIPFSDHYAALLA
jgi:carbonic anhydrase